MTKKLILLYGIVGFVIGLVFGATAVFISKVPLIFLILPPIFGFIGGVIIGIITSNIKSRFLRFLLGGVWSKNTNF